MKANELKVTDLMVGDWVICYHPSRLKSFEKVSVGLLHTMQEQEYSHIKEDCPLFRIVEPVPLTPEILEKNGFDVVRGNRIMRPQVSDKCTLRIGDWMKEIRVEMQNWGKTEERKWFIEICNFGSLRLKLYIGYVHELQHALRLCKIEKEIVL